MDVSTWGSMDSPPSPPPPHSRPPPPGLRNEYGFGDDDDSEVESENENENESSHMRLWSSLPQQRPPTSASASGSASSSSRPPSASELDRLLFHVPLADFGLRLQRAAEAVFPNTPSSRYRQVHVLLVEWEEGDPCLPVHQELEELRDVFEHCYRFQTEIWRIPCKAAHRALNRKITDFVELEDDGRDCLKIVYYGGHGFLSPGRQLMWSNLPSNAPRHQSVKWHAIQATLEDAESDVLLLLDCCAAGTASTDHGNGVTELIGACAFNVNANGVGEFSFTTALSKELQAFSKIPSFTVGRLYNNLLRRTQMTLSHMTLQKAPVHVVLTQDHKLPRSIQLSPLPPRTPPLGSELALPEPEIGTGSNTSQGSPSSKASDNDPFSLESSRTSMSSLSLDSSARLYPRIALSVQLPDNVRPDQLSEDLFRDWLRMIPVIAENVKVEAGWASFSSLVIVSVPMLIWRYIEEHPAVKMVGIIRSPNVIVPKTQSELELTKVPSMSDAEAALKQNFRTGLRTVKSWFGGLGKRKQREVLFKLHDIRAAEKFHKHRARYMAEAPSVTESDYWTSEMDTGDEREHEGSRVGRRRHRSRTRSSEKYGEPELAVVRFNDSPPRSKRDRVRSSNDSAYGSVTSGSRSRKPQRNTSISSLSSFDQDAIYEPEKPHIEAPTALIRIDSQSQRKNSEILTENPEMGYRNTYVPMNITSMAPSFYSTMHGYPTPPSPPSSRMNSFDPMASILNYESPAAARTDDTSSNFSSPAHFSSPSPIMSTLITSGPSAIRPGRVESTADKMTLREGVASPKEPQKVQFHFSVTDDHELPPLSPVDTARSEESIITERVSASPQPYDHLSDMSNRQSGQPSPEVNDGFLLSPSRNESGDVENTAELKQNPEYESKQLNDAQVIGRVVSPPKVPGEERAVKGILRQPRDKFPEDPVPIREGVAALKDAKNDSIPPDARWTRISRKLVNPKALEEGKERFEAKDDYVVVLRVLSREEVQGYADATAQIRAVRNEEKNRQIRIERRNARYERYRQRREGASQNDNYRASSEGESQSDAISREDTA